MVALFLGFRRLNIFQNVELKIFENIELNKMFLLNLNSFFKYFQLHILLREALLFSDLKNFQGKPLAEGFLFLLFSIKQVDKFKMFVFTVKHLV